MDAYLRVSGTTNYQAAFNHILRTQPALFAEMQVPAHGVTAGNFNPYHDALGRFTTSDGVGRAGDHHHLPTFGVTGVDRHRQHGERPAQRQGTDAADRKQVAARGVDSIAAHVYDNNKADLCAAACIQTMIATITGKEASGINVIEGELMDIATTIPKNAEGNVPSVKSSGGLRSSGAQYAELMQKVLAQNGVKSTVQQRYGSTQEMAAAIISAGKPAIINIVVAGGTGGGHAVPVQWDAKADNGKGRVLMNNVLARGETRSFTREQFASGKMMVITAPKTGGLENTVHFNIAIDNRWPVIFCEKP